MSENKIDYNALGQAMDTSFGRSSQEKEVNYSDPQERTSVEWSVTGKATSSSFSTRSVKASFVNENNIQLKYSAIVQFASEAERFKMVRNWEDEAKQIMNEAIKNIKKVYKEFSDKTITLKEVSAKDSVEIFGGLISNPRKTAYYRRHAILEVK